MSERVLYEPPGQSGAYVEVLDVHRGARWISLGNPGTLYCDIDGTIADLSHRKEHVEKRPKNWKLFEAGMHLDLPILPVIEAVNTLAGYGWRVAIVTGRGAQNRQVTVDWLKAHGVVHEQIYMRAKRDYRKDRDVKFDLFQTALGDGYTPDVVLDDRNQVVDMWRENGVECIQVAHGDF